MSHPVRMLVVEDMAFLREMLAQLFTEKEDIHVAGVARSGPEFLSYMDSCYPDVALIDLVLPGENGISLIQHITKTYPEIKIIACSSLNKEHIVLQALQAGADDFIAKPFNTQELKQMVLSTVQQ